MDENRKNAFDRLNETFGGSRERINGSWDGMDRHNKMVLCYAIAAVAVIIMVVSLAKFIKYI